MIASTIGQEFLSQRNARTGHPLTPDQYFRDVFVELFFNHPNYFIPGGNSPLEKPQIQERNAPRSAGARRPHRQVLQKNTGRPSRI